MDVRTWQSGRMGPFELSSLNLWMIFGREWLCRFAADKNLAVG